MNSAWAVFLLASTWCVPVCTSIAVNKCTETSENLNKSSVLCVDGETHNINGVFNQTYQETLKEISADSSFAIGRVPEVKVKQVVGDQNVDSQLEESDRGMKKKLKKTFFKLIPFLIVPAFIISGIVPWIIPFLKIGVMFVTMMTNFAFTSALMAVVRNYVFNSKKEEHIIYVNQGYKEKHVYHKPHIPVDYYYTSR